MKKLLWCLILPSACFEDTGGSANTSGTPTASTGSTDPTATTAALTDTGGPASTGGSSSGGPDLTTGGSSGTGTGGTSTAGTTTTGDAPTTTTDVSSSSGSPEPACLAVTAPCTDTAQCCADLQCGTTTLGQVCCGLAGASCVTANGEDCCGALLCINGACV